MDIVCIWRNGPFKEKLWRTLRENSNHIENLGKILKVLVLVHVLIQILIAVDRKLGIYASLASLEFWNVKGWKQFHVIGHGQQFFCKWLVKLYGKINECPVISMEKQLKITYFSLSNNSLSMWNTSEKNVIYIKNIVCV